MRHVFFGIVLSLFVVFPYTSKAQEITLGTLLEDMIDRSRIAEFPNPEFLSKQCSSYNRETVARGEPGWFANGDSSYFHGYEDRDGRREWIMMDVDGPGAVVRWWLTQQKFDGVVRIYLDGSEEPVYAATADKLVGGDAITGKPLSNVVGWNGRNLYLPIPFKKHCRITYDGPNQQVTGKFPDCLYYNINYTQYPAGTPVKTFTREDLKTHAALLDHVQTTLLQPEAHTLAVARKVAGKTSVLGPGESVVRDITGNGAISRLKVKIAANDMVQAMRSVVLSVSFDDKERVLAPVGEFFGCGPGLNPFKGWWRQVQKDGWMTCWWPMPFTANASVKIINHGSEAVSVELGDISISDWTFTDRTLYFNSTWRSENHMNTGEVRDWNYLTAEGKGVYVGDTLALFNKAELPHRRGTGTWWGEGDEKIFVDGEVFPSTIGTGTEDYYGYAWGVGGTFEAPFHAMPRGEANGNYTRPGHTTNTRVRSLDRIPFKRHLQLDMELLHWQKIAKVDYAVATYWYASDNATGNGQVTRDNVRVTVGDLTGGKNLGVPVPSQTPGQARATMDNGLLQLGNDVISMSWDTAGSKLKPTRITDLLHGDIWSQTNCDMFAMSTDETLQNQPGHLHIGMRIGEDLVDVMVSGDGQSWQSLHQYKVSGRGGLSPVVRIGKMDMTGGSKDYMHGVGADGMCSFREFEVHSHDNTVLVQEDFSTDLDEGVWRTNRSQAKGTSVKTDQGTLVIATGANCASNIERPLPEATRFVSCGVNKGTDTGMSWGPGLALVWEDGEFVVCGVRSTTEMFIHTKDGERILPAKHERMAQLDMSSSTFKIVNKPSISDVSQSWGNTKRTGKAVQCKLLEEDSGLKASWRAILFDDTHYVRQEFSFNTSTKDVPVNALELLHCRIGDAVQIGSETGSPAATDKMFAGVELPVYKNSFGQTGDLRGGFNCQLTLTPHRPYRFSTVVGVYAQDQLRRSFLSYIESERARPSSPFLHYNCWYDLGYGLNADAILDVAQQFHTHLAEPFSLKIDSYVLDDGWDNTGRGLWATNLNRFPKDFNELNMQLEALDSNMGIWISPMGGYGGDKQRTALAKDMGLIKGDTLDLAEEGYYKWYRNKCRSLMQDDGINYFKWDRAGSGASPHFMALLNIARELREVNPELFINVTVGTWPSPFWLNHVDSTWRGDGGDVGWLGKGNDREQWLTFRDHTCYRNVVTRAPLYPLNSIMHHGIVHGRHFQSARVSKAGSDLKNEARSYFGAGPTLQELYLTPSMMTEESWKQVGQAARWAHDNADVLLDSHWFGGDPLKMLPYGYASWSPRKGIITLRNPDDQTHTYTLDIEKVFELPLEARKTYQLKNAYSDQNADEVTLTAGNIHTLILKPFEVLVLEAEPLVD